LLSVTFNPSGDFSPIGDTFAKLPVTGTVQAVDGVFGTMTLKPDVGSVEPENVLVPFISGTPKVGVQLTANIGGWIGASSFAYLWKVGGTTPGGTPVDTKFYTPVAGDVGKAVTVEVTATNVIGDSDPAESEPTANVAAA